MKRKVEMENIVFIKIRGRGGGRVFFVGEEKF
jgi:hypothetical protein